MTTVQTTPLPEYYDMLSRHDWFYMMSDDRSVYSRGSSNEGKIQSIAKQSPEHRDLYEAYVAYTWKKGPKPERPNADG